MLLSVTEHSRHSSWCPCKCFWRPFWGKSFRLRNFGSYGEKSQILLSRCRDVFYMHSFYALNFVKVIRLSNISQLPIHSHLSDASEPEYHRNAMEMSAFHFIENNVHSNLLPVFFALRFSFPLYICWNLSLCAFITDRKSALLFHSLHIILLNQSHLSRCTVRWKVLLKCLKERKTKEFGMIFLYMNILSIYDEVKCFAIMICH